jgi:hypothetical protein
MRWDFSSDEVQPEGPTSGTKLKSAKHLHPASSADDSKKNRPAVGGTPHLLRETM